MADLRVNCCEVCNRPFVYKWDGETIRRCRQHRKRLPIPAGRYLVVTFVDGVDEDQEVWLASMLGRVLYAAALADFIDGGGMDGAVVQHQTSGRMYRIEASKLVRLPDCVNDL